MINKDEIFTDSHVNSSGFLDEQQNLKSFAFNSKVASVFDDMVSRSVPGYEFVQNITADFISLYAHENSTIIDLGCSTATTLIKILNAMKLHSSSKSLTCIGVDSSPHMITRAQQKLEALGCNDNVILKCEDFNVTKVQNASFVISHYTLQFVEPSARPNLLKKIYDGMNHNSYFLISEKIHFEDSHIQKFYTDKYYDFKRANGYTEVEIIRKREALENVLITFSEKENIELLKAAGFFSVDIIHSELLFKTFLAKKV